MFACLYTHHLLLKSPFIFTQTTLHNQKQVHQEFGVIDIINVVVEDNKPPL